ncbi:DNA-formamidopyrimidine glycosylase family protein [Mycoplasma elephantis]|uniref:DNA-formamidopyrimidine glycosylase family protein n=1 Tax=Mycoplasma elephantis TaxID=114882 RepID=UPI000B1947E1|nr:DNA-formamidopyrimidine glycosylase family protein [Mycoplasma elephantis]
MPELPAVKVVVKNLKSVILNKNIEKILILQNKLIKEIEPNDFINRVKNSKIIDINNIGKFIVFKLSNNEVIISHLRMEGKYRFLTHNYNIDKHCHLIFYFSDNTQLRYYDSRMFGTFHLRKTNDYLNTLPISKLAKTPEKIDPNLLYEKIKIKKHK